MKMDKMELAGIVQDADIMSYTFVNGGGA